MELQVQIDDVTACPGRCPGCALSPEERKSPDPDMSSDVLVGVSSAVAAYARELQPDSVNVTFGIADHLMMGSQYVRDIYRVVATDLASAGYSGESAIVFFSTSMIANERRAKEQIETLTTFERVAGIDLIPVVVLDPQNLRHKTLGPQWRSYVDLANKSFGRIDLALNLSSAACSLITPLEILDYVREFGFQEVTINWTPTDGNLKSTASDMPALVGWLIDFADRADARGVSYSYGPVMSRAAHSVMCRLDGVALSEVVDTVVDKTIRHSIHVDADGSLYPKFEAIGDIPHSPRFGYSALGNVLNQSISSILDESLDMVKRRIMTEHFRDRRCVGCKYLNVCATTGFHAYSHVLEGRYGNSSCPHVARALWDQTFVSMEDPEAA